MVNTPKKEQFRNNTGGNWDKVWLQDSTAKQLIFLNKIGFFYISASGLLSKFINKYKKKDKQYYFIEIGCGGSSYLPYLEKKFNNLRLFGLDKSLMGCKLAVLGMNKGLSSLDVFYGDIIKPPLKSDKFDIVFSLGLIEHFDDPDIVLKKHVDLLKPGGLLICHIPNVVGIQGKFFRFLSNNIFKMKDAPSEESKEWIWGMKIITMEDLTNWLKNIGLKDITVTPIGGIYPMLMMESYKDDNNSLLVKLTYFLYRYLVCFPLIVLNIPFSFRLNSLSLSPLIVAVGLKK